MGQEPSLINDRYPEANLALDTGSTAFKFPLLREFQSIFDLNAEVPNRAFQFGVSLRARIELEAELPKAAHQATSCQ